MSTARLVTEQSNAISTARRLLRADSAGTSRVLNEYIHELCQGTEVAKALLKRDSVMRMTGADGGDAKGRGLGGAA